MGICSLFARFTLALALAGLATACSRFSSLCEDEMACRGGNDADVDACIAQAETSEALAENRGCEDAFDELLACAEDDAQCTSGNNFNIGDSCLSELADFERCVD